MNKEAIFQAGKPKTQVVDVPAWGDGETPLQLTIQQVNVTDLKECLGYIKAGNPPGVCQIIASVINGDGQRLFSWEDIPQVGAMSGAGIAELNIAIDALNGWSEKK